MSITNKLSEQDCINKYLISECEKELNYDFNNIEKFDERVNYQTDKIERKHSPYKLFAFPESINFTQDDKWLLKCVSIMYGITIPVATIITIASVILSTFLFISFGATTIHIIIFILTLLTISFIAASLLLLPSLPYTISDFIYNNSCKDISEDLIDHFNSEFTLPELHNEFENLKKTNKIELNGEIKIVVNKLDHNFHKKYRIFVTTKNSAIFKVLSKETSYFQSRVNKVRKELFKKIDNSNQYNKEKLKLDVSSHISKLEKNFNEKIAILFEEKKEPISN
ncbi:MAG: hypothetical protein WDZ28_04820 [Simkaniaceae bacterium]